MMSFIGRAKGISAQTKARRSWPVAAGFTFAWVLALSACGGGASDPAPTPVPSPSNGGSTPSTGGGGQSSAGDQDYARQEEFVTWTLSRDYLRRQPSNVAEDQKETPGIFETGDSNFLDETASIANQGSDYFVIWSWSVDSPHTRFKLFSAADVRRQRTMADFRFPRPLFQVGVFNGFWRNVEVSHRAHYIAGAFAADRNSMASGQRLLGIVDTQMPEGKGDQIKAAPGGEGEKVDTVQWVSDDTMIVRNLSGRKFAWNVATNTYYEMPYRPAKFGNYTLKDEFYAPDAQRFGGLMTNDGGQTYEVWTSKPDYSDMQQITYAGLKLSEFQWLGSSKYLLVRVEGLVDPVYEKCGSVILNAQTDRVLSASQVKAARVPDYLPCSFQATR